MNIVEACKILGLEPSMYTEEDIKKAYKDAALRHHPDKGGNHELFIQVTEALNVVEKAFREGMLPSPDLWQVLQFRREELQDIVKVRTFFLRLEMLQMSGVPFELDVVNDRIVTRFLEGPPPGRDVFEGHDATSLPQSAVRFVTRLARRRREIPDLRCTYHMEGVNAYCTSRGMYDHYTAEEIALKY